MFKSRLPSLVWFVVSASALYAWWFATEVVLRWVAVWMQQYPVLAPPEFSLAFEYRSVNSLLFYGTCVWLACLGCLIWAGPVKLRKIEKQLQTIGVISFVIAGYLLGAAAFGSLNVNRSQAEEQAVYRDTLKRFALLESAQGRWNKFQADLEGFRQTRLVKARPVEQWSDQEVWAELELLAGMLHQQQAETQRMVLATIALFRGRVVGNAKMAYTLRNLPTIAANLGLGQFSDPASVLETVAAKNRESGWGPLPLVRIEVGTRTP